MKVDRNISDIISRYLKGEESAQERQQLYEWYDKLSGDQKMPDMEALSRLKTKGYKHLLTSVKTDTGRIIRFGWYNVAAACILLIVSVTLINYYLNRNALVPMQLADLEKIMPQPGKSSISLSTGETVDVDSLSAGGSKIGNITITRNELGQIVYLPGNGATTSQRQHRLTTTNATQYTIILSDSTVVYMNANSRLSYPENFGNGDRIVQLDGQAYFEVKKTAAHSRFIVKTATQSVEVLGTHFDVNAYADQPYVKTTLAEGSVRVIPFKATLGAILLQPDQQAILTNADFKPTSVDAENIISWKDGFFVFDGNNTGDIIREIGRWYNLEVDYQKDKNTIEYSGRIPKNISLARLLELLNYSDIKIRAFRPKNNPHKIIIE